MLTDSGRESKRIQKQFEPNVDTSCDFFHACRFLSSSAVGVACPSIGLRPLFLVARGFRPFVVFGEALSNLGCKCAINCGNRGLTMWSGAELARVLRAALLQGVCSLEYRAMARSSRSLKSSSLIVLISISAESNCSVVQSGSCSIQFQSFAGTVRALMHCSTALRLLPREGNSSNRVIRTFQDYLRAPLSAVVSWWGCTE